MTTASLASLAFASMALVESGLGEMALGLIAFVGVLLLFSLDN